MASLLRSRESGVGSRELCLSVCDPDSQLPTRNTEGRPESDQDAPYRCNRLVPETKLLDERSVGRQVASLEIGQQAAASSDHLEQAAAAVMVLQVGPEVVRQGIDPLGEQCHLYLGRAGIGFVGPVLGYYGLLVKAHA